jgi:hypothetical protein
MCLAGQCQVRRQALWQEVPIVVTNPAQDQKPAAPGERRPVAMTPHAIAVALFAAFVVGGILGKAVPLWLVAVLGLAIGAAVFVFVDRYPRSPRSR